MVFQQGYDQVGDQAQQEHTDIDHGIQPEGNPSGDAGHDKRLKYDFQQDPL